MDFDQILAKCGDFNRYQFMLLALFGFINIIVSMVSIYRFLFEYIFTNIYMYIINLAALLYTNRN